MLLSTDVRFSGHTLSKKIVLHNHYLNFLLIQFLNAHMDYCTDMHTEYMTPEIGEHNI